MEILTFNKSPAPTIGVELEIQILDSETYELTPLAPEVLKMVPDNLIELIRLLTKSGTIESVKDIWWDVRPHPDFGTVEVRICDVPYCMRDILALTALVQALVVTLTEQQENPEPHMQILRTI